MNKRLRAYFPGFVLFLFAVIIGCLTYQDYGLCWDSDEQREIGEVSYNYVMNGDQRLLTYFNNHHGVGFELPLYFLEKKMNITDTRDVFLMRHFVTHLFFLLCAFCGYVLMIRIFRNQFVACLGFIMLVFAPRLYAHSFFNTKDIPFLGMFIVSFAFAQLAFDKKRMFLFFLLGVACGYTTSIRILGIILTCTIALFFLFDILKAIIERDKPAKQLLNAFVFFSGFCLTLYAATPFLWTAPVHNFIYTYNSMAHYPWLGSVLFKGTVYASKDIPWNYGPIWFLISTPELWLVLGFSGIVLLFIGFLRRPMAFLNNTVDRNFVLYLVCFFVPLLAVVALHSIIYDDWRHLYFVYPGFVMLALYAVNKAIRSRYKRIVQALCILQVGYLGFFFIKNHPEEQVYFNCFVSHSNEYLHKNYEMDYWGVSYKQAFEYIFSKNSSSHIKISIHGDGIPMIHNVLLLQPRDRTRIEFAEQDKADYLVTTFRTNPGDIPAKNLDYSIRVLNSTILAVYKLR